MSAIGTPFVAYLLDAKKMPTLTNPQLQIWLDTMASFCVFDEAECRKRPAMRKEYYQMMEAIKQLAICDRVSPGGDLAGQYGV